MIGWGYFWVTGDSRRTSAFREPAVRPSAAGSSRPRLMAEKPMPESQMPMAVTRHLKLFRPRVGLTTLGQPRLSEGAQPYLRQTQHPFRSPVSPCALHLVWSTEPLGLGASVFSFPLLSLWEQ